MSYSSILTVNDILKLNIFKNSLVLAGNKGLNKSVERVHVLEVTNCKDYINGKEIVLTTGAGWVNEVDPYLFVNQLIEKNVSALCIQLGNKFNRFDTIEDIPEKIIKKAETNNFPIVIFPKHFECRYVDLVHSLHSMIINRSYKTFQEQELFLEKLNPILLGPHTIEDIIRLVHDHQMINVAYIPLKGKAIFIPPASKKQQAVLKSYINNINLDSNEPMQYSGVNFAIKKVKTYGQKVAHIIIYSDENKLSNTDFMVLEKCSVVLGQELLLDLLTREKKKQSKEKWVYQWLDGKLLLHEIDYMLQSTEPFIQPTGVTVCLVDCTYEKNQCDHLAEAYLNLAAVARTLFYHQGFSLIWHKKRNYNIYILLDTMDPKTCKARLNKALQGINDIYLKNNPENLERSISFSIGRIYDRLDKLHESYLTAIETTHVRLKHKKTGTLYYDDLHVYRIILLLENSASTESFLNDYLGPLLNKDTSNMELLKTLIALRDCHYNKKDTAEKLLIARQSLYQRIKQIDHLLGEDFMSSPEKRICTEIALYSLEYKNSSLNWDYL